MKFKLLVLSFLVFTSSLLFGQRVFVQSPNQKTIVELFSKESNAIGEWYLRASYNNNGKITGAIPRIDLGLLRSDQDFSKNLKFLKAGKPILMNEEYTALHGKKSVCKNAANEIVVASANKRKFNRCPDVCDLGPALQKLSRLQADCFGHQQLFNYSIYPGLTMTETPRG
jgi:hypothetical protein